MWREECETEIRSTSLRGATEKTSGFTIRIKDIILNGETIREAHAPMSVVMTLEDEIDISRGDMIVRPNNQPEMGQDLELMVCWMNQKPMTARTKYLIRHTTKAAQAMVKEIQYKVDINTLHRIEGVTEIGMNDIAKLSLRSAQPLFFDSYAKNRQNGALILIDPDTNETVGAAMVI